MTLRRANSSGCFGRRLAAVTIVALLLCSCQSVMPPIAGPQAPDSPALPAGGAAAATNSRGIVPERVPNLGPNVPLCPGPLPIPYDVKCTACASDELLCDGGDHHLPVMVSPEWRLYGLDPQDTVMHFDTLDGRTLVEPSNCVCLYAPRFGAVRSVARLAGSEQIDVPNGMMLPTAVARQQELKIPATSLQRYQARGEVGRRLPEDFVVGVNPVPVSSMLRPVGFQDTFLPFENLRVIRQGIYESDEKARLAQAIEAAIVWTDVQALQVTISGQAAVALTGDQRAQATYAVKDLRKPCLRVIKVASTQTARPGDTVDFTIRFDNLGEQPLGNLVLVDHLTTRLEYVPGSAQSSVETHFTAAPAGDGKTAVLRWEVEEPLEPGHGGLVRFRCRVL
jgi:uncharacterized repeat protein (TIGR01451 family)